MATLFLNIAFQAEISRYEDEEFEEVAKRNCNENPLTRTKAIEELRSLIYERGICNPRRIDDAYLLRFLRCRWFIPALAHKLVHVPPQMYRYEDFARRYAYLYDCDPFKLDRVEDICFGVLPESPDHGRITFMRLGKWNYETVPIIDVVRCALFMDEMAAMQPKLQILGVTIIVDMQGVSIRHIRHLTPTIAYQMVSLMGVSFPLLTHCLHIINYSWYLHTFFYLFKQFIPRAAWQRLHFHGSDLSSLHAHIHPQYLPPQYGGTCKTVITTEEWIRQIDKYKDDFTVRELKELGFKIKC